MRSNAHLAAFRRARAAVEIAQTIVAEYDVAEDRCSADLLALVADLGGRAWPR